MAAEAILETILRDAIQAEIGAHAFYTDAGSRVTDPGVRDTLLQFAREELGHRAIIEKMLTSPANLRRRVRQVQKASVQDYRIGDHLVAKPIGPESTFQDVCIVAAHKERESHELYVGLAEESEGEARELFEVMAKEELRHKNLAERWYEEANYREF